jgi:hypothetical protein
MSAAGPVSCPPATSRWQCTGLGARHRGDGADPTLVAVLGVALEQPGGEHNLVTKGGPLELLLGGEGLQGERPLLVPTASATSATAAPSTTDRLPASAEPLSWSCVVLL